LFADFGTSGAPGTFKIILVDVFVGMARSEFVVTIPLLVYVDDVAMVSSDEETGNVEMRGFITFTGDIGGMEWQEEKLLTAAQIQTYVGFIWNSRAFSRSLPERKLLSYLDVLLVASRSSSLLLNERQSLAGKMQRAIMTLPPGAACLLVNCYILMSGLSLPWHRRRTTRAERSDYRFVHDLLQLNQGKGYYSYDGFKEGFGFRSDASKRRGFAGGGYTCEDGPYDFWRYGSSAMRKPIDFLEGDTVLRACDREGARWFECLIPAGIDNSAFELSAEAGRSRAPRLNDLLRGLFVVQIKNTFILQSYWISTHDNYLADHLSRDRESDFLAQASDFVLPDFPLSRHSDAGRTVTFVESTYGDAMSALRQLLKEYRSNDNGDGPARNGSRNDAQVLSVPHSFASIYDGLLPEYQDRVDELMDNRLRPSSMRKVITSFKKWEQFCYLHDWDPLILSRDPDRGGRMVSWIVSMCDDTELCYASISLYVWGMRSWQVLQRQSDPAMGIENWREFMRSVAVVTAVPGEPRKRVPLEITEGILKEILEKHWDNLEMVQLGLILQILVFTFSRTECPCPKNYTGDESFDPSKHWEVKDFVLRKDGDHWILYVRFKAIKQDPRIERDAAKFTDADLPDDFEPGSKRESKDWVPLGDTPSVPHFSIANFFMRFVQLMGRARDDHEPMFLAKDGKRPYLYRTLCAQFNDIALRHGGDKDTKPHGIRVESYNRSKKAVGVDLTVAHGGWSAESSGHARYDRFASRAALGVTAGIIGVPNVFGSHPVRPLKSRSVVRGSKSVVEDSDVPSSSSSDSDDDEQPVSLSALLPDGYTSDLRVTANGRRYTVFHAPNGELLRSRVQCWKHSHDATEGGSSSSSSRSSTMCSAASPSKNHVCTLPHGHMGLHDFENVVSRRRR
jgi:hypothetical protein